MNMAGTQVPSRAAPPQGPSRESRVKDDGAAAGAARGDDDGFREVMSDLAETKRGEAGSAGADSTAQKSASRSVQGRTAGGNEGGEQASGDSEAAAADALAQTQAGPSLLEQVAMALGVTPAVAAPAVEGPKAADTSVSEMGILSASRQLLSSLGAVASEGAGAGAGQTADAASLALAALNDNAADVTLPAANAMESATVTADDDAGSLPAMKVTVTGEETHFAPVKSGEETLSRLLANPATEAGTVPAEANAAPRGGTNATAKDSAAVQLATAGEPAPVVVAGDAAGSRSGGEESRGDGRPAEGQARATAAEQQGARLASVAAAEFHASASAANTGIADPAAPAAQIARRIAAELANPTSRPATVSSGTDGAVKVLHLQLEPNNLGSVTVRLALKDDVISVHLEASRHETALALEKDRAELSNALKSAGYVVDNISSQPGDMRMNSQFQAQPVANDGQMGSSLQSHGNAQQDLAQSGRGNQGDSGRQGPDRAPTPSGINERRGEGSRASGGALYV